MPPPPLRLEHLDVVIQPHFWSRRRQLVFDLSLTVQPGEILGFLGPNGAGKTTTLRAAMGLLTPAAGTVELFGAPVAQPRSRSKVGFMPEQPDFPVHLRGRELVYKHARLAGLAPTAARQRGNDLLQRVGLGDAQHRLLGTYSKGMLQRLGMAQALAADPDLAVLDEPLSGLDPLGRRVLRELMTDLRSRGKSVFFATHILPDVEQICDRVAIMVAGRLRKVANLSALTRMVESQNPQVQVVAHHCPPGLQDAVIALVGPQHLEQQEDSWTITASQHTQANQLVDLLRQHGAMIQDVSTMHASLEDAFVHTTERSGDQHVDAHQPSNEGISG